MAPSSRPVGRDQSGPYAFLRDAQKMTRTVAEMRESISEEEGQAEPEATTKRNAVEQPYWQTIVRRYL